MYCPQDSKPHPEVLHRRPRVPRHRRPPHLRRHPDRQLLQQRVHHDLAQLGAIPRGCLPQHHRVQPEVLRQGKA